MYATSWLIRAVALATALFVSACASLRSNPILPIDFSSQPPRAAIRGSCNGEDFTTQGVIVCEQKAPSLAKISVKVPPLEGRIVYSNGQLKKTDDFNWYPKEGFWIWKKKPIKDTWLDLDLGEIAATFGDWPVALDIVASSDVGVIDTRGIIYHRVCNDQELPCSKLVVQYECGGHESSTGPGVIGKCLRLAGSSQAFRVRLDGAKAGAKLYVVASRLGVRESIDVSVSIGSGFEKIETPSIPTGPTLIQFALAWYEGAELKREETRVLIVGFDPAWTGLDQPHYLDSGDQIEWAKPVFSDIMETDLYAGQNVLEKRFGVSKTLKSSRPQSAQIACAYAWQRDSSDLSIQCVDKDWNEVPTP